MAEVNLPPFLKTGSSLARRVVGSPFYPPLPLELVPCGVTLVTVIHIFLCRYILLIYEK